MNPITKIYRSGLSATIILLLLFFVVAISSLSGCKANGDVAPVVKTTLLNVVNANADTLNFYRNGTRLNNISGISPGSASNYLTVPSGTTVYQFKIAGPNHPNYIIDNYSLTLDTPFAYSLFAAGETADKLFLTKDVLLVGSSNSAMIRFVNASPGSTNLSVTIGSVAFSNQAFKSAANFTYITGGTYVVNVYQAGATTPLIAPQTITVLAGTAYTLFTKGVIGGTGQNSLSASLIINSD